MCVRRDSLIISCLQSDILIIRCLHSDNLIMHDNIMVCQIYRALRYAMMYIVQKGILHFEGYAK